MVRKVSTPPGLGPLQTSAAFLSFFLSFFLLSLGRDGGEWVLVEVVVRLRLLKRVASTYDTAKTTRTTTKCRHYSGYNSIHFCEWAMTNVRMTFSASSSLLLSSCFRYQFEVSLSNHFLPPFVELTNGTQARVQRSFFLHVMLYLWKKSFSRNHQWLFRCAVKRTWEIWTKEQWKLYQEKTRRPIHTNSKTIKQTNQFGPNSQIGNAMQSSTCKYIWM